MYGNCFDKEHKKQWSLQKISFRFSSETLVLLPISESSGDWDWSTTKTKIATRIRIQYICWLYTSVSKMSRGAIIADAFSLRPEQQIWTNTGSQIYSIEINSSAHETRLPTSGRKGRRVLWADEFISLKILAPGSISMKEISPSTKLVCPPHHLEIRVRKQENRVVGVARW